MNTYTRVYSYIYEHIHRYLVYSKYSTTTTAPTLPPARPRRQENSIIGPPARVRWCILGIDTRTDGPSTSATRQPRGAADDTRLSAAQLPPGG